MASGEATHHDDQQTDHRQPKHENGVRADPQPKVDILEKHSALQPENTEFRVLEHQEPKEVEAVPFTDAGSNPRAVMVVRPYAMTTISTMLRTQWLVD